MQRRFSCDIGWSDTHEARTLWEKDYVVFDYYLTRVCGYLNRIWPWLDTAK